MTSTTPPPAPRRNRGVAVRKWVVVGLLAVALLTTVGWLVLPPLFTSQATLDTRDVFCLQPGQQAALADAAVALGVADSGSSASGISAHGKTFLPPEWRTAQPGEFRRTCDALAGVQEKPVAPAAGAGEAAAVVLPLLTVVLTAALSYVSARWQGRATARSTVGQGDAKDLRGEVTAYRNAVGLLLDDRVNTPPKLSSDETNAAREVLAGRLAAIAERNPGWVRAAAVVTLLRTGDLDDGLDERVRAIRDRPARLKCIEALREKVREAADTGGVVAEALAGSDAAAAALTVPLTEVVSP